MAKRRIGDLTPGKHSGVPYRTRLTPKQEARLNELLAEFIALRSKGVAPRLDQATELVGEEVGLPLSTATLRREIARYERKNP